jgi:hypothetical protein
MSQVLMSSPDRCHPMGAAYPTCGPHQTKMCSMCGCEIGRQQVRHPQQQQQLQQQWVPVEHLQFSSEQVSLSGCGSKHAAVPPSVLLQQHFVRCNTCFNCFSISW